MTAANAAKAPNKISSIKLTAKKTGSTKLTQLAGVSKSRGSLGSKRSTNRTRYRKKAPKKASRPVQPAQRVSPASTADITQDLRKRTFATKFFIHSDFMKEDTMASAVDLGDLNNKIHPIFRPANFPDVPKEEYSILEPSLRLASKMLGCGRIKPLLYTIIARHKKIRGLHEWDNDGKELCEYREIDCPNPPLGATSKEKIRKGLKFMRNHVTFCSTAGIGHIRTEVVAGLAADINCFPWKGKDSRVEYPTDKYNALVAATRAPQQDIVLLLTMRFEWAVELVHELMHALQNARESRNGPPYGYDTDPFVHKDLLSEIGFAMEARVFGGHFTVYDGSTRPNARPLRRHRQVGIHNTSRLEGIPVLWRWPCIWKANQYMSDEEDLALWARQGWKTRVPEHDLALRVFPEKIGEYFTNAFWATRPLRLEMKRSTNDVAALFSSEEDGSYRSIEPTINDIQQNAPRCQLQVHETKSGRRANANAAQGVDTMALDLEIL